MPQHQYLAAWAAAVLCLCCVTAAAGDAEPASEDVVMPAHGGGHPGKNTCGLLSVCNDPDACPIMREVPPEQFTVRFKTNVGSFRVRVTTAWAPPFATRMWQLARLRYMNGGRFYRVVRDNFNITKIRPPFVVQFGFNGIPEVDSCWDEKMGSMETAPVIAPGNIRGFVSFAMGGIDNKTSETPYCTYPEGANYCALGFAQNIFINLGNNTFLNGPGFAIFGVVPAEDMAVVDRIYGGYGEVADGCYEGGTSTFCNGFGNATQGVDMDRLLSEGTRYLVAQKPLLSYIRSMDLMSCKKGRLSRHC